MALPVNAPPPAVTIRPLAAADLDAVVALDAASQRRTRRAYIERRLAAARREGSLHVQFGAAEEGGALLGFVLARVLEGEFGRREPALRLELVGVRAERRGGGIGRQLLQALAQWAARHGCIEVRTTAHWRDHAMLGWFDAMGFTLAAERIVECDVAGGAYLAARDHATAAGVAEDAGDAPREIDYGREEARGGNDYERLARDAVEVRSMSAADLDAIARIDRRITGADRRAYIAGRLAEALQESGVRVSLAALSDGTPAGYLMARADLGDFGRTEPVAVIDTMGVEPGLAHHGIGRALLSQLFANLGALRVERVETVLADEQPALAEFFRHAGFVPSQRLGFVKVLENPRA